MEGPRGELRVWQDAGRLLFTLLRSWPNSCPHPLPAPPGGGKVARQGEVGERANEAAESKRR